MSNIKDNILHKESLLFINDEHYFKYIFKKTEKVVCTIFFIFKNKKDIEQHHVLYTRTCHAAHAVLDTASEILTKEVQSARHELFVLTKELLMLESRLRTCASMGIISADVLNLFVDEIESIKRTIRTYVRSENVYEEIFKEEKRYTASRRKESPRSEVVHEAENVGGVVEASDRQQVIMEYLNQEGESSIKDIHGVVKDMSEKTLQRELQKMIKDNLIQKKGERRWSVYYI